MHTPVLTGQWRLINGLSHSCRVRLQPSGRPMGIRPSQYAECGAFWSESSGGESAASRRRALIPLDRKTGTLRSVHPISRAISASDTPSMRSSMAKRCRSGRSASNISNHSHIRSRSAAAIRSSRSTSPDSSTWPTITSWRSRWRCSADTRLARSRTSCPVDLPGGSRRTSTKASAKTSHTFSSRCERSLGSRPNHARTAGVHSARNDSHAELASRSPRSSRFRSAKLWSGLMRSSIIPRALGHAAPQSPAKEATSPVLVQIKPHCTTKETT